MSNVGRGLQAFFTLGLSEQQRAAQEETKVASAKAQSDMAKAIAAVNSDKETLAAQTAVAEGARKRQMARGFRQTILSTLMPANQGGLGTTVGS